MYLTFKYVNGSFGSTPLASRVLRCFNNGYKETTSKFRAKFHLPTQRGGHSLLENIKVQDLYTRKREHPIKAALAQPSSFQSGSKPSSSFQSSLASKTTSSVCQLLNLFWKLNKISELVAPLATCWSGMWACARPSQQATPATRQRVMPNGPAAPLRAHWG